MANWQHLPPEILTHLFGYLPRRDRLCCSLVCKNWRTGLDHPSLWKSMVVYADTDLSLEPSTVLLLRDYNKYLKNLEFGRALPNKSNGWFPYCPQDITKKAVRFFLILYDNYVQIESLRIFNWNDFISFQKIAYHLARFVRVQINLKKIIIDNTNIASTNSLKIISSFLTSKATLTHLDITTCYYYYQNSYNFVYFRSCIEQLFNLKTIRLDYSILACDMVDTILTSNNKKLERMDVSIKEPPWFGHIISEDQWKSLLEACPELKVSFAIRNVYYHDEMRLFLKQTVPLVSFSLILPKILDRSRRCNFKKTITLLINNYHKTLSAVDLHIKNESEVLDDVLLRMLKRCKNLKTVVFNGIMEKPQLLKTIYPDLTCYSMLPQNQITFNPTCCDDLTNMRHKRLQFTSFNHKNHSVCRLLILN